MNDIQRFDDAQIIHGAEQEDARVRDGLESLSPIEIETLFGMAHREMVYHRTIGMNSHLASHTRNTAARMATLFDIACARLAMEKARRVAEGTWEEGR